MGRDVSRLLYHLDVTIFRVENGSDIPAGYDIVNTRVFLYRFRYFLYSERIQVIS